MRQFSLTAAFSVALAAAILASCGGGGGSSLPSSNPTTNPTVPPGSGNPAPGPSSTSSPTAAPSGKPTASPSSSPTQSPSPVPTHSPTPAPTQSPTPVPTQSPTPVPTKPPTPTPAPTSTPNQKEVRDAGNGSTSGTDNQFLPGGGAEAGIEGQGDGDYSTGGRGQTVDGITCDPTMFEQNYHVHVFVGVYVNGQEIAIPDGLGMLNPGGAETFGYPNQTEAATCFYHIHVHDPSGLIHIEDPSTMSRKDTLFSLGNVFDIFGITVNSTQVGPFSGPVTVYTSGQFPRGGPGTKAEVGSNTYTLYTGDPNAIPLYSHEVIWLTVGSGNPSGSSLPNVEFFTEW